MWKRLARVAAVLFASLAGFAAGCVCGATGAQRDLREPGSDRFLAAYVPLPHHVAEHEGGLSLRFAMVHDVIHERFPKHGPAFYRERDRLTRQKLTKLAPDDPTTFALADDLAAGLDRLGRPDEAVEVMRQKLARQEAAGLAGRDLYTSYANLGTFLIHGSFTKAVAGDADPKARFREGVGLIRRSVEVNPQAHFGRERWQAVIAEFLLAAMDRPELLKTFDCVGNRLDVGIEVLLRRGPAWVERGDLERREYGRPYDQLFGQEGASAIQPLFRPGVVPDDPANWKDLNSVRKHITKIGGEPGWDKVQVPSHLLPVPFDGPVLGMIGMWRQGGGANPHFALALGETMLRVGQRYIAWTAFERAARMAGRFWPDPALQQALREHCRRRQGQIEETLRFRPEKKGGDAPWQHVSPPPEEEEVAGLRARFEAELAHGEGYQRAYQEYEAARIAAGASIEAEGFFDAFNDGHEPIASSVGPEETFAFVTQLARAKYVVHTAVAWGAFGAGLVGMVTALLLRWRGGPRADAAPPLG